MSRNESGDVPFALEDIARDLAALLDRESTPPPEVLDAARGAFVWRTVDAELAALTYDSVLDDEPAAVRTAGQPRIVAFDAAPLTIEVEVDESPGARRLLGQLTPPGPAQLELVAEDGPPVPGAADEIGRFTLPLPDRPRRLRMRVTPPGGRPVESAWVSL